MRKHLHQPSWRHTDFEAGFGEQLKRLNKNWVIKKHYYKDDSNLEDFYN